jgi:mannose-6-phosphate isomerase-like protein (cupin superfamily)
MSHPLLAALADAKVAPIPPGFRSPEMMRHGSMVLRFYQPKGTDPQTPHEQDEVYIVASGRGTFFCAGQRVAFGPGDALFAPAKAEHRFEGFSADFAAWVIFYGPKGGEKP